MFLFLLAYLNWNSKSLQHIITSPKFISWADGICTGVKYCPVDTLHDLSIVSPPSPSRTNIHFYRKSGKIFVSQSSVWQSNIKRNQKSKICFQLGQLLQLEMVFVTCFSCVFMQDWNIFLLLLDICFSEF